VLWRIICTPRAPWAGDHQEDRGSRGRYRSQDTPRELPLRAIRSFGLKDLGDRHQLVPAFRAAGEVQLCIAPLFGPQLVAEKRDQLVRGQMSGSVIVHRDPGSRSPRWSPSHGAGVTSRVMKCDGPEPAVLRFMAPDP
jgi:hypothetical protein